MRSESPFKLHQNREIGADGSTLPLVGQGNDFTLLSLDIKWFVAVTWVMVNHNGAFHTNTIADFHINLICNMVHLRLKSTGALQMNEC
jgi:hypothetical protein